MPNWLRLTGKAQALEQQVRNLEGIKLEQEHALEALLSISQDGADGAMIPLGAGVQLVADIPPDGGAVIDIGSRIQAEKTREEAAQILGKRNEELNGIMDSLRKEYEELEKHVVELATKFNDAVEEQNLLLKKHRTRNSTQQMPPPSGSPEGRGEPS